MSENIKVKSDQNSTPRVLIISLKSDGSANLAPPTGLYMLQGYLAKEGIDCTIADRDLDDFSEHLQRIYNGHYQIIGLSISSYHLKEDIGLIWDIKTTLQKNGHNCIFIGGGQEATMDARNWIDYGIDLIFKGFCERELVKFCKNLTIADFKDQPPALEDCTEGIEGIVYKKDGQFVDVMAPAFTVEHLTELCYDTVMEANFPYKKYWGMLKEQSADTTLGASDFIIENVRVYTTSHCPRQCGFCSSQSFLPSASGNQMPIVMLDAYQVANLVIMYHERYGATSVLFSDDDFPVGNKQGLDRLETFCHLMLEAKAAKKIPENMRFSCQARIFDFLKRKDGKKVVNMELLKLMRKAGFMSIGMGVETYTDRMLKMPSVNKIGVTAEDCRNVINAFMEIGLVPQTNLILGIPEYTADELVETLETAFDYIKKGADVATTIKMMHMAQAPMVVSGQYKSIYKTLEHPYTKETITIPDYFEPQDPIIREGIDSFKELAEKEVQDIREKRGWEGKILHKRVTHVCNLIGVARGIKRNDVADSFRQTLEDIMDGKNVF